MPVDKELLFKSRLEEAEVELPFGTVRVRALSREEVKKLAKIEDHSERDLHMLAMGLVDPKLSVTEVKRWSEAAAYGELEPVSMKIGELSGLLDDSAKAAYKSLRDESGTGMGILHSTEVGDASQRDASPYL